VGGGEPSERLDAWVLATAPRAVAYARSLLRHPQDAEDVVQDCYCRLLARADSYDLPRDGQKLLLKAITNACINLRTRRKPFSRLIRNDEHGQEQVIDPNDPQVISPEQQAMHGELSMAVAEALQQLPPLQRAAVELKSLGHTQQEIAEILQVTPSNAGVLVHRARHALAVSLAGFLAPEVEE